MRDARDVLRRPVISEKSVALSELDKYSFWVDPAANKIEIKNAVEKMFKVGVTEVHTMNVKGHIKRVGRHSGKMPDRKKAVVTVRPGDKIEGFAGL